MPVIHVFHGDCAQAGATLARMCTEVALTLEVPVNKVWGLWHPVSPAMVHRPDWDSASDRGPIVRVFCRRSHPRARVLALMQAVRTSLGGALGCPPASVFVQVIRVDDEEVLNVT